MQNSIRRSIRRFQDRLPSQKSFSPSSTAAEWKLSVFWENCLALLFVLFVIIIFVEIIAKLVIGALFLGHCDAEPRLPVFVLVSGFVPFIIICCPGCEHHRRCNLVSRVVELLLMLGWLGGGVLLYVLTKRTLDECQQTAAEMPEVTTTSEKTDRGHTTAAPPDDVGGACTCDDRLVEFTIPAIILDLICLVIPYFILTGCVESEEKSKIAEDNPDHIGESNPDFPAVDPDFAEINLDFAENDTPRNTLPR